MKSATTFEISKAERLAGITKEKWTKPRSGRMIAYVVRDRLGQHVFLGQKLPQLCEAINERVRGEPWARVSANGLWESVDRIDGRTGPWCKGRWRVCSVDLEHACEEYERARLAHERAVVVAEQPACYAIRT